MNRKTQLTIERKDQLLVRIGLSRSTLYTKINAGLWCPPIPLGGRAVGFLKHESDELLIAHINHSSDEEKRKLVQSLVAERRQLLAGSL